MCVISACVSVIYGISVRPIDGFRLIGPTTAQICTRLLNKNIKIRPVVAAIGRIRPATNSREKREFVDNLTVDCLHETINRLFHDAVMRIAPHERIKSI